jgi:hypothetical protein
MDDHGGDRDPEVATQQVAQRRERRSLLLVIAGLLLVSAFIAIVLIAVDGGSGVNGRPLLVMGVAVGLMVVLSGITVALVWWAAPERVGDVRPVAVVGAAVLPAAITVREGAAARRADPTADQPVASFVGQS